MDTSMSKENWQPRRIENWYPHKPIPDEIWEVWVNLGFSKNWELIDEDTGEVLEVRSKPRGGEQTQDPTAPGEK